MASSLQPQQVGSATLRARRRALLRCPSDAPDLERSPTNGQVVHMEESIARHRQHIVRLEQILRLLDNDAMAGACSQARAVAQAAMRGCL